MDKVALIKRGVYLVRCSAMDTRDKIVSGHYFSDIKPFIVKLWPTEIDFEKEKIKIIHVLLQLKIALKYWGENHCIRLWHN